ncbi:AAA family ATPase [Bacillus thuringiensis]|uniref:AAA family ATPase n=1 Tax=Bacillus thuringiensis TaxID=1428 RepID=UPI000A3817C2|nr:AAA family ATPase [Bacillus thuringiensis]OUA85945.1 hypothetical protein BK706_22130 [Bacillus thuringiensis serovar leesis]
MYLTQVKIKNFRGYGENIEQEDGCYVYDDLDSQLVIFHGYNGFGKTSFYEAIEWCLTDNVYRLEKFYQERTYQANELKKSHYLKFYHPVYGNKENREIYVELIFNTGLRIIRESKSNVLRTTKQDKLYSSKVSIGFNDDLKVSDNQNLLHIFISNIKDKTTFFHTHLLGQESISDFLRSNSPTERRRIFMQLLQEEELNKTFQDLEKYTVGNNALVGKKSKLEKDLAKHVSDQGSINTFLENLGFKNVFDYVSHIEKEYLKIDALVKQSILEQDLDLSSIMISDKINLSNCIPLLQGVNIIQSKATVLQKDLITIRDNLSRIKNNFKTLRLLEEAKKHATTAEHAKKLKQHKITDLTTLLEQHSKNYDVLKEKSQNYELKRNDLLTYRNTFLSLSENIRTSELKVTDEFWIMLRREVTNWRTFINSYKKHLEEQKINLKIDEIDPNWFLEIKKKEAELQVKHSTYNKELAQLREVIATVTKLNNQHQKALTSIKQLIMSDPNAIDKCPVCLNDEFNGDKYSPNIKGWKDVNSVAEKLLAIIDNTFSSGNTQLEQLSTTETQLLKDIQTIEKQIKEEVIDILTTKINKIITVFNNQFKGVMDNLTTNITELNTLKTNESNQKQFISEQLNQFTESLKFLFGDQFNINDFNTSSVDKYIADKTYWFAENGSKLGFEKEPSISELTTELSHLDDDLKQYQQTEIEKQLKSTIDKIHYIDKLTGSFKSFLKYKIPTDYEEALKKYNQLEVDKENILKDIEKADAYKELVTKWHGKLLGKQRGIVKERLEKHPIISWVYETINPHPFHTTLHITNTERGTNFVGRTQLEDKVDLYLDQIFSAAQLNILSLSIFLGLGLTQRYSKLQQLFLDDPIQSMDDVNVLAFIDVLRAIMDSKYSNKHMIISTHDEDFAQLLAIKMRNRQMVQYRIEGYTEEGPKIRKI